MQYFRNEKGSTLLLVVITIAMLTVLGTTVISMSIMNTNMKYTDDKLKRSLYYSESGIEQVYSVVASHIDSALVNADNIAQTAVNTRKVATSDMIALIEADIAAIEADENIQKDYREEYLKLVAVTDPDTNLPLSKFMDNKLYYVVLMNNTIKTEWPLSGSYAGYAGTTYLKLEASGWTDEVIVSENGGFVDQEADYNAEYSLFVDSNKIEDHTQEEVNTAYKEYFDLESNQDLMRTGIKGIDLYLDDNDPTATNPSEYIVYMGTDDAITLDTDATWKDSCFTEFGASNDEFVINNIQVTFDYRGQTRMTVATDIVVKTPGDTVPMELTQDLIRVNDNPLWQYALISHNNVVFDGTIANVDGSVYALGTRATETAAAYAALPTSTGSPRNSKNYEGVVVTGNSANVDIDGDVISQSYVQTDELATNSSLTIRNGHVYTDSLVIQSNSSGTNVNNEINVVEGNVYTRDDIELNGGGSHIDIDGSYFGFMNSALYFNKTSAIVVNADLSDANTYLRITGDHADIHYETDTSKDGVYIAGVSYVNDVFASDPYPGDVNGNMYQSGESLGLKGNIRAYIYPTSDDNTYTDGTINAADFHADQLDNPIGAESNLYYYYRLNDGATYLSAEDKVEYFISQNHDSYVGAVLQNGVNGGTSSILIDDYKYTQGAVYDSSGNVDVYTGEAGIVTTFLENEIARDFTYIMHFLKHRPESVSTIGTYIPATDDAATPENDTSVVNFIDKTSTATVITNYSEIASTTDYVLNLSSDIVESGFLGDDTGVQTTELRITKNDISGIDNFLLVGSVPASDPAYSIATGDPITINSEQYTVIHADAVNAGVMQGILITTGKVRIRGDLTYYGSIIAMDEIRLENDNITLKNSDLNIRQYLAALVFKDLELKEMFDDSGIPSEFANASGTIEYVNSMEVDTGDVDALRINYDQLLYYKDWEIVE